MVGSRKASSSKKKGSSTAAVAPAVTDSPRRRASSSKKKVSKTNSRVETEEEEHTTRSNGVSQRKLAPKGLDLASAAAASSLPAPSPMSPPSSSVSRRPAGDAHDAEVVKEFGGPVGVTLITLVFPLLMFYFWSCLEFHQGQLYFPKDLTSGESWKEFGMLLLSHVREKALPTVYATQIYIGYVLLSAVLAYVMPGVHIKGMPVPSLNYKQLVYNCNGYSSFYATVFGALLANHYKLFPLRDIVDNFGHLMAVAVLTGFIMSIVTYVMSLMLGTGHRLSGNHIYDFFMGAPLNPRVGSLDLKMWCEIRVPWIILFFVSLSAVVKVWENEGADVNALFLVPAGLWFTLLGHWLYVNACMKGEDCIPVTWDIFYEKWGFMLIFWNMAGVPFTYCYNTLYLLSRYEAGAPVTHSWWINTTLVAVLLAAYYVWDVAQAQKSHFRQYLANKKVLHRWTFPQLPGGFLDNPSHIKTKHGSPLLTDGFWGVARKIHYTADFTMSMCWALICGFSSPIPYFYPCFFLCVLVHRVTRDMERCAHKYGDDWVAYCKKVPYIFIPGIF